MNGQSDTWFIALLSSPELHGCELVDHCLSQCSTAAKRHHDHSKASNWGWLTVQRFIPLLAWWEAWWLEGRHGAGEVTESSTSRWTGIRKREWARFDFLKPQSPHQWHTSSNKTEPIPTRPQVLILSNNAISYERLVTIFIYSTTGRKTSIRSQSGGVQNHIRVDVWKSTLIWTSPIPNCPLGVL